MNTGMFQFRENGHTTACDGQMHTRSCPGFVCRPQSSFSSPGPAAEIAGGWGVPPDAAILLAQQLPVLIQQLVSHTVPEQYDSKRRDPC